MENITVNEEIAKFHGWRHRPTPKGQGKGYWDFQLWGKAAFNSTAFQYHRSWEWLMPVVEKITRHVYDEDVLDNVVIKETAFLRTFGMVSPEGKQMVRFNRCALFEADTLIEATYQAVVDWIRQYNNLTGGQPTTEQEVP